MVGFPNKPIGFPTKHDDFGVEIGGTTIQKYGFHFSQRGEITFGSPFIFGHWTWAPK